MSAPNTNVEKQKRRHWGPLVGISLVLILAIGAFVYWLGYEIDEPASPPPQTPAVQGTPVAPGDVIERTPTEGMPESRPAD